MIVHAAKSPGQFFYPITRIHPSSVTKGIFTTGVIIDIPLDPFHVCMSRSVINKAFLLLQNAFSLLFGEHFDTLSDLPTQIEPHVHSLRRHGFRVYSYTNTAHREAPREHSRNGQQGREDILCHNIYNPLLDFDHVRYCKGRILCVSARRV